MPDQGSRARPALVPGLSAGRARPDQLRGGNHGLTREQVVESQRERVLEAMREAVAARGFRAVPVADVIPRAGVSRKTFYELYASKEECFVAVYAREMQRLVGPALQAFDGGEPWGDRLRTALGVLLGGLASDPAAGRICFVEVLTAGPLGLAARSEQMAALDRLFERGDAAGEGASGENGAAAPEPPRSVTPASVGYLFEVLNREIAAGRTAELPGLRAELMYTLTLPFVGPDRAGAELTRDRPAEPTHPPPAAGEQAFLATYGEAAAELLGRVASAIAGETDAERQLRAGVAAVLAFCADRPDGARRCFVEALSAGPAARERRSETGRRLSDLLEQPLRELRPSERIARVSAIALVGGLHELLFDPVDRKSFADLPPLDTVLAAAGIEPRPSS